MTKDNTSLQKPPIKVAIFFKNYLHGKEFMVECEYQRESLEVFCMKKTEIARLARLFDEDIPNEQRVGGAGAPAKNYYEEPMLPRFHVSSMTENQLVCDVGRLSYDGAVFGERLSLQRISEELSCADYQGRVWIEQTFTLRDAMPLTLMMEKGDAPFVTLNSHALSFCQSELDFNLMEADMTDAVKVGENRLLYEINDSRRDGNCLYDGTHGETVFIKGDFILDDGYAICAKKELPPITSELPRMGYPFFDGTLTLDGFYSYDGHGDRILSLRGSFLAAEVYVNGARTVIVRDTEKEITDLLVIGKNEIRIVLHASGGNTFGLDDIVMLCEDRLIRVKDEYNLVWAENPPKAMMDRVAQYRERLKDHPRLARLYENGFLTTIRTVMDLRKDGTYFGFVGDIPGMWLRDSTTQVMHYVSVAKDPTVAEILEGLMRRQFRCIAIDPYANAFNSSANGNGHIDDMPLQDKWVFERKYEIDSLCYPIRLLYLYWKETGNTGLIREVLEDTARIIVDVWRVEQHHMEKSPYRFIRPNPPVPWDTIPGDGMGSPVAYTGMTWCAFRPSDDGCTYGYLTASEMFAVVVLGYMAEMLETVCGNSALAKECLLLRGEIDEGIQKYCIVEHERFGKIYACETDGMGHYSLIDDANVPSLLSIPYIGYASPDDEIYQNTRRFLLCKENPFYFEGAYARGIGSRHTPENYVWHISLAMQGLTSNDKEEKRALLDMISSTDADTGLLHEGFDVDHPENYTRDWFPWPNALFVEFIEKCVEEGIV